MIRTFRSIWVLMLILSVNLAKASEITSIQQFDGGGSFNFNEKGISREVLENYLDRSVTMASFLMPEHREGRRSDAHHKDDIRMIKNIGAKFIGRTIYRWGNESLLNEPGFWSDAKSLIDTLNAFDPEMVFQACLFEIVTED